MRPAKSPSALLAAARGLGRDAPTSETFPSGGPFEPETEPFNGPLLTGRLLCGKWRIERLLGVGGMSVVYAARHRNGNRVAIKVLRPELAARRSMQQRFLREGYLANRVGHEGAATVLDDDASEDGIYFLVMELVEGESLESCCLRSGGRLPAIEVVEIGEQLLDVVAAAHKNGVLHRDIKPSNVFVTAEGRLKLLDFGIATLRESASVSQTASGALLGTPAFMAPEQARGRHREVDARTDLWAVGAALFRLLSGRLVHQCSTPHETMIATATEPAPSLAELCPDIPRSLALVVDRALELDPARRFQTASSMQAALRAIDRASLGVSSDAVSTRPVPVRLKSRMRVLSLASLAVILAALAVASSRRVSLAQRVEPLSPTPPARAQTNELDSKRATLVAAPNDQAPALPQSAASAQPLRSGVETRAPSSRVRPQPRSSAAPEARSVPPPPTPAAPGSTSNVTPAPNLDRILGSRR